MAEYREVQGVVFVGHALNINGKPMRGATATVRVFNGYVHAKFDNQDGLGYDRGWYRFPPSDFEGLETGDTTQEPTGK